MLIPGSREHSIKEIVTRRTTNDWQIIAWTRRSRGSQMICVIHRICIEAGHTCLPFRPDFVDKTVVEKEDGIPWRYRPRHRTADPNMDAVMQLNSVGL